MSAILKEGFADRLPDAIESRNAAALRAVLDTQRRKDGRVELGLANPDGSVQTITLTPEMAQPLLAVLDLISSGQGFTLVPLAADLSTQQAANHLNVSRPYLIKLLEQGEIPFTTVGRHRRVRAVDLFAYKARRDASRARALEELAALDADLI